MSNRREHRRFETTLSVEIHDSEHPQLGVAMNLSTGGVGVSLDHPLEQGSTVNVSLFLVEEGIEDEKTQPLALKAKVVWCHPYEGEGHRAGLRLLGLTPPAQTRLKHFLGRLAH